MESKYLVLPTSYRLREGIDGNPMGRVLTAPYKIHLIDVDDQDIVRMSRISRYDFSGDTFTGPEVAFDSHIGGKLARYFSRSQIVNRVSPNKLYGFVSEDIVMKILLTHTAENYRFHQQMHGKARNLLDRVMMYLHHDKIIASMDCKKTELI